MAFWYTCFQDSLCLNSSGQCQVCFHSLRCVALFTTYASCLLMCFTCYVHELYISLCLLFRIIPSMWVIVPAKPWWSIETFGMLIPPKDSQNDWKALVSVWKPARCACFLLYALIISSCFCYPHSLNLDIRCLLCFPYIGLSLLTIFCCVIAFPQIMKSDAQDAQRDSPCKSECCVLLPY